MLCNILQFFSSCETSSQFTYSKATGGMWNIPYVEDHLYPYILEDIVWRREIVSFLHLKGILWQGTHNCNEREGRRLTISHNRLTTWARAQTRSSLQPLIILSRIQKSEGFLRVSVLIICYVFNVIPNQSHRELRALSKSLTDQISISSWGQAKHHTQTC